MKHWQRPLWCVVACGAWTSASMAQAVYVNMDAQAWSNGLPVMDMDGPWQSGYDARAGQQRAYQSLRAEVGVGLDPAWAAWPGMWRLGLLERSEVFARMSGATADLLATYQGRTDPAQPQVFDANHHSLSWRGRGMVIKPPAFSTGPVQWDVSMQWLRLGKLRTTSSAGIAAYEGAGTYAYQVALQDDNSRASIPFVDPAEKSGYGISLSVGAQGHLGAVSQVLAHVGWSLRISDAWSRLAWNGVNGSDGDLTSQVSTKTPEGYTNYRAALQTQYTRRQLLTHIPSDTTLQLQWQQGSSQWFTRLNQRWGLTQTWLGWQHTGPWQWLIALEPQAKALQLGLDHGSLRVRLTADQFGPDAHVQGVSLAYALALP
jgi:hypothetical protein